MPPRITVELILCISLFASCRGPGIEADLLMINGTIITVDADDNVAQGVAVRNGRILAVGTNREVARFVGPNTRRIDLNGLTATPGLLDAHAHFGGGGATMLYLLDLSWSWKPTASGGGNVPSALPLQYPGNRVGEAMNRG